jgi:hypothetical protein
MWWSEAYRPVGIFNMDTSVGYVRNGIVLMLDALGIKNLDINSTKKFLDNLRNLYLEMNQLGLSILPTYNGVMTHRSPKVILFGDTVLCIWDLDKYEHDVAGTFFGALNFSANIIILGLKKGIFLRGAISTGEYIFSNEDNFTSYLGPVIYDVASWCEEVDWIGIITTPHCGVNVPLYSQKFVTIRKINEELVSGLEEYQDKDICYKVDYLDLLQEINLNTKHGSVDLFAVKWPLLIISQNMNTSKNWINEIFATSSIPKGVENKYINTIAYYNKILSEHL